MMPASLRRLCAAFTLVLLASASAASAMDPGRASPVPAKQAQVAQVTARLLPWRVVELTGEARMRVPGAPFVALAVGDAVPIGNEVVTGRDSELRLERNKDRMTLSAASWVQLAPPQPGGLLDRFIQSIGTILYDVEPRRDRSFGVEAPYVAAVVKGTRFIVTTNVDLSSVQVEEGKVLVTARDGAGEAMVEPGETAVASPREAPGLILSSFDLPAGRPALAVGIGTADTAAPDGAGASANGAAVHAGGPLADAKGVLGPASDDGAPAAAAGASSGLGGAVTGVGGAVGGTAGALGGGAEGVADGVGDLADGVADALGGTVGAVGGAVGGPVGDIAEGLGETVDGVGDVADDTVDSVGDVVGGALKGVGGLVGGLAGGLGRRL